MWSCYTILDMFTEKSIYYHQHLFGQNNVELNFHHPQLFTSPLSKKRKFYPKKLFIFRQTKSFIGHY